MFSKERFKKIIEQQNEPVSTISKETGISRMSIWAYIRGDRAPNYNTACLLAKYFNIDLNEFDGDL